MQTHLTQEHIERVVFFASLPAFGLCGALTVLNYMFYGWFVSRTGFRWMGALLSGLAGLVTYGVGIAVLTVVVDLALNRSPRGPELFVWHIFYDPGIPLKGALLAFVPATWAMLVWKRRRRDSSS